MRCESGRESGCEFGHDHVGDVSDTRPPAVGSPAPTRLVSIQSVAPQQPLPPPQPARRPRSTPTWGSIPHHSHEKPSPPTAVAANQVPSWQGGGRGGHTWIKHKPPTARPPHRLPSPHLHTCKTRAHNPPYRRSVARCPRGRVVVAVGMAHLDGIEREWMRTAKKALPT